MSTSNEHPPSDSSPKEIDSQHFSSEQTANDSVQQLPRMENSQVETTALEVNQVQPPIPSTLLTQTSLQGQVTSQTESSEEAQILIPTTGEKYFQKT